MSVETDSNIKMVYMRLIDEGTDVMRPVAAQRIDGNVYKICIQEGYDPEIEMWEFEPGSIVYCKKIRHDNEIINIADKLRHQR